MRLYRSVEDQPLLPSTRFSTHNTHFWRPAVDNESSSERWRMESTAWTEPYECVPAWRADSSLYRSTSCVWVRQPRCCHTQHLPFPTAVSFLHPMLCTPMLTVHLLKSPPSSNQQASPSGPLLPPPSGKGSHKPLDDSSELEMRPWLTPS